MAARFADISKALHIVWNTRGKIYLHPDLMPNYHTLCHGSLTQMQFLLMRYICTGETVFSMLFHRFA